jgi:hypothetical protein
VTRPQFLGDPAGDGGVVRDAFPDRIPEGRVHVQVVADAGGYAFHAPDISV